MKMSEDGTAKREPNRLGAESSPYLQQHALNPVDWYPWGEEAFEKARAEDKPIFLSVGYSACHWCHVMEHESFEDDEIADLLNRKYVSIKVDREERPDVDQIYMSAVQLITKRGGWPMSVFMTPDGKPFYGGTYWPPTAKMGMPGFMDILLKLTDYWQNKRNEVDVSADQLVDAIQQMAAPVFENTELTEHALAVATKNLIASTDKTHGGFGQAPKFPHSMDIRVLLRGWYRFGDEEALNAATLTLDKMAAGGIYDHLGGGFHRYSTDAVWLVPHFEKMLYDNALLVPAYLEAYQAMKESRYAETVRHTLDYILREMTSPDGGFYSTQDADSEGVEGKFFIWSRTEIESILTQRDAEVFCDCYDVTVNGNWEGSNILNLSRPLKESAANWELSIEELASSLNQCREKLYAVREQRIKPGRDEKILVSWNGMMISAMAMAGAILNEPNYVQAAVDAARFAVSTIRDENGKLLHSYKDGQARFAAYLDDFACLIDGLVELYQTSGDEQWLAASLELADDMVDRFHDADQGGFYYTANDHEKLIARTKDNQDNAVPSGNGMASTALLKLARLCGRDDLEQIALGTLNSISGLLVDHPRAVGQSLLALDFAIGPAAEIVITEPSTDGNGVQFQEVQREIQQRFLPNKVIAHRQDGAKIVQQLLEGKTSDRSLAYVCERGACQVPAESLEILTEQLAQLRPSRQ